MTASFTPTAAELRHLRRCVELATEALEAGDEPFGSVLVAADGAVLAEDHNRVASGDRTRHPEFELARWAAANMTPEERAGATLFTSGEHCPMCAAAHGWVGLGRIVYVTSSEQLAGWLAELGVPLPPVRNLAIREIVTALLVEGPVPELAAGTTASEPLSISNRLYNVYECGCDHIDDTYLFARHRVRLSRATPPHARRRRINSHFQLADADHLNWVAIGKFLSRVLLGADGTTVLRRSDEPVVDRRSDALRSTRKSIALRRFGGTSERRYRRRLGSAAYRPSTLLTKQFVTENGDET